MNKCEGTLRLRSCGCVTCARKCSFPSLTGAHALHRLTQAAHRIRQEHDGLTQVRSGERSHLRGGRRGRWRRGAGSRIGGGSCSSSHGASGCGHRSSGHKTGGWKGSGGGTGRGGGSRKCRRPRRSHRYHTSCARSITSGATGTSGVTTRWSARQNRSRIPSTVGRSSGTDSRGLE